ncbi:voltage-gated ion channel superfamily [Plasmopara halstedii]|uniref:Voltage-gated ion channel superfamily n=1 Tax=Plasmopara halstedii TaxID=4781 RepID=A0A0P1B727_PLAHL|nr:voltage-gated ion channel superfamily [Plasmopara halstedii]CEG50199.1 voltage-gated ion channel superfamily [Plasmopara halstedii]|eukprot:XP_024586568.1 voltage-gated ion channel superfamily [Plasmopara halstedii]
MILSPGVEVLHTVKSPVINPVDHFERSIDLKRRLAVAQPPKGFGADYLIFRFLPREHKLREWCVELIAHKYFDRFIIAAIVANSIILGLSDFSVVDTELNPASSGKTYINGKLIDAYSLQNHIVEFSELPFTIIFTGECVLKIIAMGIYGKGSYGQDMWNVLDFFVVVSSLVASLPGMPNVSAIRTIRVLRPLRSLSVIPGMRRLIAALLKALPALGNVVILQIFVFFIFGILGIQLFGGSMNRRCRLTTFPVKLPLNEMNETIWPIPQGYLDQVTANEENYLCIDAPLLDYEDSVGHYTKETSPWSTAQPCFWPVDEQDEFLCAATGQAGNHACKIGKFCGSDWDAFGNPRFSNRKAMDYALYRPSLDWGLTTFDNIGRAFFTIFQSITQEGWTAIMYMVMDSSQPTIGAIFFVGLIIFASFFVMNLTLAVISEEFNLDQKPGKTSTQKREEERRAKLDRDNAERLAKEHWLNAVVSHKLFAGFIMAVILANTAVLALDHYPMPTEMDEDLEIVNFALSCVFVLEMVMKLFGLGLRQYSRDRFNLFDAFIVTMGILETVASPPSFMSNNPPKKGAVSALRSFRLFRVFKLARDWKSLRELLEMIFRAVASITNFGVLLFLFIYIYALIGVQFFGNTMRFDNEGYSTPFNLDEFWDGTVPRNNFDTLLWAAVTVFQIITGENWNGIMYFAILGNGMLSCIYFISLVILGDFVLMNLFLALLLDNFGDNDEEQERQKQEETKRLAEKMSVMSMSSRVTPISSESEQILTSRGSFLMLSTTHAIGARRQSIMEVDEDEDEEDVRAVNLEKFADEITPSVPLAKTIYIEPTSRLSSLSGSTDLAPIGSFRRASLRDMLTTTTRSSLAASSRTSIVSDIMPDRDQEVSGEVEDRDETVNQAVEASSGKSLFLFADTSKVRRVACYLSTHRYFDSTVFGLIVLSSIALAVDNPLANPESALATFLKGLDKALAIIFAIEMVIKIVAMGLVMHKGAYLRNGWNIIDGVIVVSSLIMLVAESSGKGANLKSLRSLRGLRTFRPLRMISRRPGLKLVVNALFEAIPEVINVLFVCMLFFLIFSIVAVNYLKGTFNACSGDVFDALSEAQLSFLVTPKAWKVSSDLERSWFHGTDCQATFPLTIGADLTSEYVCKCWGANWEKVLPQNFDNVGSAMLTFFEISTTEGWADVMMAAIDSNGIGMQPIRDNNMIWALFFVLFIMVGSFFVVNLFVGVIIDNFNRMKAALGGDFMLTPEQKKWIEAQKAASRVGPVRILKPPKEYFRRHLFNLVTMQRFEWFIMICIIVNTVLMAAQYFGESTIQGYVINILNEIFAVVFTLEAVMKLTAFGWEYFEDRWNQFDFFVVLGTLLSVVVESLTGASVRSLAMLVRVFRVTRILRLVKASKSIRQILLTLYIALPGLSNITSILFLMLFIYATMGVQIFAKVALTDNIDEHANFQDFGRGFLFLLRAATGEAWNSCMHDLASYSPGCVDDPPYDPNMCGFHDFEGCIPLNGCGNPIAYGFFCTFTLLVTYVMLNLTIAVILEGFSLSHEDEEPLFEPELLDEFQTKWADIDPKATGFVKVDKLLLLINLLKPPLGKFGMPFDMAHFFKYMCLLEVPLYDGEFVYFRDVLLAMTREMVKVNSDSDMPDQDSSIIGVVGAKRRIEFFAHQYFGARRIQRRVAEWLYTKRQLERRYMEEYKTKIKKPSGRPKRQRDARVFTVG